VPPLIIWSVAPVVLGCQANCINTRNAKASLAVVGDVGPHKKIGEVSDSLAAALGLNPSPVNGGTSDHIIRYQLWPGVPAKVDGKTYALKSS